MSLAAPPSSVDVAVIGAGAAGIAAARRLAGTGLSVAVLEARLAKVRPELLPSAEDYDKVLRARIDGDAHSSVA